MLLCQTRQNEIPVSVAIYHNTSFYTDDFPELPDYAFYSDSTTPFKYKLAYRFNYLTQLIISRKFGDLFSLQLSPTVVYRNLTDPKEENLTWLVPISGAMFFGNNNAFLFEYGYSYENKSKLGLNPLSIGVQFGTAGHVFQLLATSTNNILEQNIYTSDNHDYLKGEFSLGFNIRRTWWF